MHCRRSCGRCQRRQSSPLGMLIGVGKVEVVTCGAPIESTTVEQRASAQRKRAVRVLTRRVL